MSTSPLRIKPIGDRWEDGAVQLSFTLPVNKERAAAAALQVCRQMNLNQVEIASLQALAPGLTYVQVFAKTSFTIAEQPEATAAGPEVLSREEILALTAAWASPLTLLGACTGTDAHTVGLDAILNKKGYKGDKGLESYACFNVINLGSQVLNADLIALIKEHHARILLISQVITQQDVHLANLTELIDLLEAHGLRQQLLCIIGGPRINHQLALELGFDAGFGIGTSPQDVASFIARHSR